ncbi:hypothetical protein [Paenimyroides aestuarii]|uniref:Uncharacterized protein n=1 Tax=Paenimyroides aestuarii TaxID=2968490 RepID=A0ABY5NTH0_9FLAO|nr:hypothetical protein [Paenimyroides aestuarii]UUV21876.1 hypothetical protein NPX36_02150 [Paenimyroides aestuarii]
MKKLLLLFVLIVQNTLYAQTYYDADNNKIDKKTFDKFLAGKEYYHVENDSLKAFKLMYLNNRGEKGSLGDTKKLFQELNEKLHLKLDSIKPLIIYYYPGKDPCNSGGTATLKSQNQWEKQLAKKVKKIADVNTLRIYKNEDGLKTKGVLEWKKDPNALIENLFFNYHYGCGSFVIINKEKYLAVFGEYGHTQVTESLKEILKE